MKQNLENKNRKKAPSFSLAKLMCMIMMLCFMTFMLVSCKNEDSKPSKDTTGGVITYNVTVKSVGGMELSDVRVMVYKDASRSAMAGAGTTDSKGKMSFTANESTAYIIVLENLPEGYKAKETYSVDGSELELLVETKLDKVENVSGKTYQLGDIMNDVTVTTIDGETVTLSKLLETKKAVVFNFWFLACEPCKSEFPFMQQAYEEYKEDIAIIAMTHMDTNVNEIKAFRDKLGLSFYVASVGEEWAEAFSLMYYPTTIIIDRYGMISMRHESTITSKADFVKLFVHYKSEGYRQSIVEGLSVY